MRDGAAIPHIGPAQSTREMDWSDIEMRVFSHSSEEAEGMIFLPGDNVLSEITMKRSNGNFVIDTNPAEGKTNIRVTEVR